jgi:transcriptional regulator with XRE-family HTH domain
MAWFGSVIEWQMRKTRTQNSLAQATKDSLPSVARVALDARGKSSSVAPVMADLGPRIRRLRQELGLTLEDLSSRSGVSRAMLSKVERAEKSPSLSIAVGIATGLDVSLSSLLGSQPDGAKVRIARLGERITYVDPDTGFERSVLSPAHDETGVEILLHVIPPGQSSGILPAYTAPTEKYIIVHSGELMVEIGDDSYLIQTGDTFHFELNTPYSLRNAGNMICQYYVVIIRKALI